MQMVAGRPGGGVWTAAGGASEERRRRRHRAARGRYVQRVQRWGRGS